MASQAPSNSTSAKHRHDMAGSFQRPGNNVYGTVAVGTKGLTYECRKLVLMI